MSSQQDKKRSKKHKRGRSKIDRSKARALQLGAWAVLLPAIHPYFRDVIELVMKLVS